MLSRVRTERPENFQIDPGAALARGAVLLPLGQDHHTSRYRDESADGNHGTLTGMDPPTDWVWAPELGRWALDFDGSDDCVLIPASASIDTGPAATFAAWIKTAALATGQVFIGQGHSSDDRDFWIYESDNLIFWYQGTAGPVIPQASVEDDEWHHVCGTYDGVTLRAYLDGVLTGTPTAAAKQAGHNLGLGINAYGNGQHPAGAKRASDVLVYDCALPPSKIAALADPSNGMLRCGGSQIIREPRPRRSFVGFGGVPPLGGHPAIRRFGGIPGAALNPGVW